MEGDILFGYKDLIVTQQQVATKTLNRMKGFFDFGPLCIDLGFYLQQSFGEMDDVNTLTGKLQSIAYMHYVQLPYTLNVIFEQIMKGYYLESQILIRHLFETLVQLKYFYKHPQDIKLHIEKNFTIKRMINDITNKPLYKYYQLLCAYAHGFIMKDILRTDRKANRTYLGNVYNEENCTVSINYFFELMLGFINIYGLIYPNNLLDEYDEVIELFKYIKFYCILARNSHIENNEHSKKWHDAMYDLIF